MKSSAKKIELASVDDLFSTEEGRQDAKLEKIQEIPLSELHPFKNHPFKVKDDEAMMETADSIKQYGVLVPAIARPDPEGGYELVAGHRRHRASELAEKETMPVIVRDLDDDAATIIMVDSNLQRESLLPSERAFAYKMKLEAMKHQGERVDLTCSQVGNKLAGKKSSELLAEQVGQSKNQIFRFIRLTELIPELLDMVDEKKIALNPAYELSFLKTEEQRDLLDAMDSEQAIVRYADDFRILCRTKEQADRTLIAVTHWLKERLRLDVSPEKTRVVDTRRSYSEFLGFKIRLRKKGKKYVVQSHMCDKAYKKVKANLTKQVGNIKFPRKDRGEAGEVRLFNSMVMGIQNYYQLATDISIDCGDIGRAVNTALKNRLKSGKTHRLQEKGRDLTKMELQRYGKSEQLKYIAQSKEPIYPISYVQCKNPMSQRRKVCAYTAAGRSEIHDDLRINTFLLLQLMRAPTYSRSTEYADNRISLFSAQWGKCAVTGKEFQCISEIHCHHKKPKGTGGSDKYENLVLVLAPVHELIHAVDEDTICSYLSALKLDASQLAKLNKLRILANRKPIDLENQKTINSHNGMTKETKKTV